MEIRMTLREWTSLFRNSRPRLRGLLVSLKGKGGNRGKEGQGRKAENPHLKIPMPKFVGVLKKKPVCSIYRTISLALKRIKKKKKQSVISMIRVRFIHFQYMQTNLQTLVDMDFSSVALFSTDHKTHLSIVSLTWIWSHWKLLEQRLPGSQFNLCLDFSP